MGDANQEVYYSGMCMGGDEDDNMGMSMKYIV